MAAADAASGGYGSGVSDDPRLEAPTAGSVMLASVMLKMGTYGLIRFCLTLFPDAAHRCAGPARP